MRKKSIILVLIWALCIPLAGAWGAFAQDPVGQRDLVYIGTPDHKPGIDRIVIDGPPVPPPGYERTIAKLPQPWQTTAVNILSDVPTFDWSYGCSATSAAMLAGYYDRTGYPDMYVGPTNGGVMPLDNSVEEWGMSAQCNPHGV